MTHYPIVSVNARAVSDSSGPDGPKMKDWHKGGHWLFRFPV
jgi:hypothetical protein